MDLGTRLPLLDGNTIPQLGLGVYKAPDDEVREVIEHAFQAGYRHIDTATLYFNERGVGQAVRESSISRDEIFVTSKVWIEDLGYDATRTAFGASLERLGLDYLDLYLIHWPAPKRNQYVESWKALEELKAEGLIRSIGVSNFHTHHLDRVIAEGNEVPVINQVELHPWLAQREVREYDLARGILTESWSPLARGRRFDSPVLQQISAKHGKSIAQVIIRWHLQLGLVVIPKSVTPARIRENAEVYDFELDAADLAAIATLDEGFRTGRDPDEQEGQ